MCQARQGQKHAPQLKRLACHGTFHHRSVENKVPGMTSGRKMANTNSSRTTAPGPLRGKHIQMGGSVTRVLTSVTRVYSRDTLDSILDFFCVSTSAEGEKSNLTAIATWRGEVRQTHSYGHFGYSKHGQGNAAVAQMDDNRGSRGNQWVDIGYTASTPAPLCISYANVHNY